MANLYFDEQLGALTPGDRVTVRGDEGRHAVRVSRLRVGEATVVGDGRGQHAHGEVEAVDRDSFTVRIDRVELTPPNQRRIVLVQALAKGDRDERAVEQATEFGVDAIIPWQAERSVSRWSGEKAAKGVAKWARIAREASKQSLRAWIPEVLPPATTADLSALDGHVLVLHPRGAAKLSDWQPADSRDIYLVVGPEGGLSEAELALLATPAAFPSSLSTSTATTVQRGAPVGGAAGPNAMSGGTAGAVPAGSELAGLGTPETGDRSIVLLGDTVLRTSSAGPAALAVINTRLGRW